MDGDCDSVDSLPDITFVLGGSSFSLKPRQYMVQARSPALADSPAIKLSHLGLCSCLSVWPSPR